MKLESLILGYSVLNGMGALGTAFAWLTTGVLVLALPLAAFIFLTIFAARLYRKQKSFDQNNSS